VLILVGASLTAIAAFLPWIVATAPFVGSISRNGMDGGGDGIIFLALGLGAGACGLIGVVTRKAGRLGLLAGIGGVGGLLLAGFEYSQVSDRVAAVAGNSFVSAEVGAGIWLLFFSSALVAVGGYVLMTTKPAPTLIPAPPSSLPPPPLRDT
jgi:hypothetical protein